VPLGETGGRLPLPEGLPEPHRQPPPGRPPLFPACTAGAARTGRRRSAEAPGQSLLRQLRRAAAQPSPESLHDGLRGAEQGVRVSRGAEAVPQLEGVAVPMISHRVARTLLLVLDRKIFFFFFFFFLPQQINL